MNLTNWFRDHPIPITYPVEGPNISAWMNYTFWLVVAFLAVRHLLRRKS
jgi:hypothetical protein